MNTKPPIDISIQENLENTILKGLKLEWQNLHDELPLEYQPAMRLPAFRLCEGRHKLGTWDQDDYCMSFSRDFILNQSWGAVIDILRHEMAHQLAMTFYGADRESAHGPGFQRACEILKADPSASAHVMPQSLRVLEDEGDAEDGTPQGHLIRKVRLLMNLARSENLHESARAAAKANELITKYNIDILQEDRNRNFISLFLGKPSLRHAGAEYRITALLEAHYFVKVVWVSAYVVERRKMGSVPEVSGTPANVRISAYVFDYLNQYIDTQWEHLKRQKGLNGHRKASFSKGVVDGFRKTLDRRKAETMQAYQTQHTGRDLMVLQDPRLRHYVGSRYGPLRSFRRGSGVDSNAYGEGRKIGEKLVIAKGISHKNENKGLRLKWK